MPAVADVQRPGRIGGDEFDDRLPPGAGIAAPVGGSLREHAAHLGLPGRGRHEEIDEAGAGDLGLRDDLVRRQRGDDLLRELARVRARGLRGLHRDVRREVAVRDVAGALDAGRGRRRVAESARRQRRERVCHELFDQVFQARKSISQFRVDRRPRTSAASAARAASRSPGPIARGSAAAPGAPPPRPAAARDGGPRGAPSTPARARASWASRRAQRVRRPGVAQEAERIRARRRVRAQQREMRVRRPAGLRGARRARAPRIPRSPRRSGIAAADAPDTRSGSGLRPAVSPRPARPATCTICLREPLARAEVRAEESLVGVEHDDQRDVRKVVALREHLRAEQDARARRRRREPSAASMSPRRRMTSRSMRTSARRGNSCVERRLDALRALADGRELVAAARAAERQRLLRAAVMADAGARASGAR